MDIFFNSFVTSVDIWTGWLVLHFLS